MAFESLPLPPGWQVVHLDLIESIYILHKWKAHGSLPTWFWSATELGEPHSLEYAQCQQGIHYTVKEWKESERGKSEHLLIFFLALFELGLSSVTPSRFGVFLVLQTVCVFHCCVIFNHKGEFSNTHSWIIIVSADVDLQAVIHNREKIKL